MKSRCADLASMHFAAPTVYHVCMEIELRHLRLLVAIADSGSISGAARAHNLAQPSVTRLLPRIERALGVRVFERSRSGVEVTTAGTEVVNRARLLLDQFSDLVPKKPLQVLRLSTSELYVEVLRPLLPSRIQNMEWEVHFTTPEIGAENLRLGHTHMFIGLRYPHVLWPQHSEIVSVDVVNSPLMVALVADHPLAGKEMIEHADLASEAWIADPTIPTTMVECQKLGFTPHIRYATADQERYVALIATGQAVSLTRLGSRPLPDICYVHYRNASNACMTIMHRRASDLRPEVGSFADALRQRYEHNVACQSTVPRSVK